MITAHTAIGMRMPDDKTLLMTVVDRDTLDLGVDIGRVMVNTTRSIYSNMLPQMVLRIGEVQDLTEALRGYDVGGIVRERVWSINKNRNPFGV